MDAIIRTRTERRNRQCDRHREQRQNLIPHPEHLRHRHYPQPPSLEKFEQAVKPGGTLIYDGYGISTPPSRKDLKVWRIDAMDAAAEMKAAQAFNMIVLGGLLKVHPIVRIENVLHALRKTLPERHHHLIPMNEAALRKGMDIITIGE